MKTLMVTGHRPKYFDSNGKKVSWVNDMLHEAITRAMTSEFKRFISGGALGVDQMFAEWVLYEKSKGQEIHLTIARPFPTQDVKWSKPDRIKYLRILSEADEVIDVSDGAYDVRKMHKRNRWMVDKSNACIAVLDSTVSRGGTFECVKYARSKRIPIFHIDPHAMKSKWVLT